MEENMNKIKTLESSDLPGTELAKTKPAGSKKMGRPKGSKNKNTIFKELMQDEFRALAENKVPKVLETLFEKAIDGDMQAIKMVMDRIVPAHRAIDGEKTPSGVPLIEIRIGNLEDSVPQGRETITDVEYKVYNKEEMEAQA